MRTLSILVVLQLLSACGPCPNRKIPMTLHPLEVEIGKSTVFTVTFAEDLFDVNDEDGSETGLIVMLEGVAKVFDASMRPPDSVFHDLHITAPNAYTIEINLNSDVPVGPRVFASGIGSADACNSISGNAVLDIKARR